jgi:hypothetical protein
VTALSPPSPDPPRAHSLREAKTPCSVSLLPKTTTTSRSTAGGIQLRAARGGADRLGRPRGPRPAGSRLRAASDGARRGGSSRRPRGPQAAGSRLQAARSGVDRTGRPSSLSPASPSLPTSSSGRRRPLLPSATASPSSFPDLRQLAGTN